MIQFALRPAQRFRLVAQHAFRRLLHVLFQRFNLTAGLLLEGLRFFQKIPLRQLPGGGQRLVERALVRFAERFVKLLREQRFGVLGLLGHAAHLIQQIGHRLLLFGQFGGNFLGPTLVAQALGFVGLFLHLLADGLLVLRQLPGLVPHLLHLFGELPGVFLARLVAEFFQLAFRAGARRQSLRHRALVQCFRRLLRILPRLLHLLLLLLLGLRVLGLIALLGLLRLLFLLLLHLVQVGQHLALLLAQSFQLTLQILLLLVRLGLLQGRLQLLQFLVDVLLPLRELLETVQFLRLFLLRRVFFRRGLLFLLVAILRLFQIKLIHLRLVALIGLRFAALALLRLGHLRFAGL